MKKTFSVFFCFFLTFFLSQKVELKKVTDSSQTFTGEIGGIPITVELSYTGIVDCDQYQHYVDGWYYYDKYKKKILLTGIYDYYGNLSLYNFGTLQKQKARLLKGLITSLQKVEKTDEIAQKLLPKESIIFDQSALKNNPIPGHFYLGKKVQAATLFTGNAMIYRLNNYLYLPNNKKINTYDFINKAGGNELISYASGENGNRVLLYFEQTSNFNACGQCGASEGEKGYRVLYFTKDWNYKNYEEFLIESCWENIYDVTKTKSKEKQTITYKIGKSEGTPAHTITVDIKNASVVKSK
ncbi:hypothetical protein J2795_003638 [Chryseobacterium bernardetii]|uniref:Uncharacterized protein n=2 Tax=Chryseobacterium TaxID=59732 RepID=A0A543EBZ9_9FLAO|nr:MULTISPECIES: hypothetical protein [Chryseobacterium]MDR6372693.1 hypothetical protein [Chryseobacterium vietnamense]MDR6442911.1 hypothetical protein [Chryseobacterium bernardetii]TQM19114.1 hypothetical protein FB551_3509 [Chryseobacterium aquifrigidense]